MSERHLTLDASDFYEEAPKEVSNLRKLMNEWADLEPYRCAGPHWVRLWGTGKNDYVNTDEFDDNNHAALRDRAGIEMGVRIAIESHNLIWLCQHLHSQRFGVVVGTHTAEADTLEEALLEAYLMYLRTVPKKEGN